MTRSPSVKVIYVSGGLPGKACGSLSPHGYYGIETQVVSDIAGWLDRR